MQPDFDVLLSAIESYTKKTITYDEWDKTEKESFELKLVAETDLTPAGLRQMSKSLYSVLLQKTDLEARTQAKNMSHDGVFGYLRLNKWFTETSGLGMAERKRYCMMPPPPKKEEELVTAIEKWDEELREINKVNENFMDDDDEKLVAFKNMLVGKVKEFIEIHAQNFEYDEVRKLTIEWAAKKRQENLKTTTHAGMDLNLAMQMAKDWLNQETDTGANPQEEW